MKFCKNLAILMFMSAMIFLSFGTTYAQTSETFDVVSFKTPKGWEKKATESAVQFTKEDKAKGTYCLMTLYKSVPGTPNAKENFDLAWTSLVKEMVTVSGEPEMQPSATEDGWETHSGYAAFESDGNKGIVILVTASGFDKMVNLIILTNTDVYEKEVSSFLGSLSLKKLEAVTQKIQTPPANNNEKSVIGTWGISVVVPYRRGTEGSAGSNIRQYTFNADGTYSFYVKTFSYSVAKLFLIRETGTYQISGDNLTVNPQKSVIEAWSKKDGTNKWGNLLSSQKRNLEKTNYRFTKHYFSGIQLWNLVLQADKVTERDGPFSSNTTFNNAWYYSPISVNNLEIELPE